MMLGLRVLEIWTHISSFTLEILLGKNVGVTEDTNCEVKL